MNKRSIVLLLVFAIVAFCMTACGEPGGSGVTFNVSFNSDGGSSVTAQSVEEGNTATEPTAPVKEHYDFLGWYVGETKYDFSAPVTADVSLKAKWEIAKYTVTIDYANGQASATQSVTAFETVELPREPSRPDYIFTGWYVDGVEYDFFNLVLSDFTITAGWEKIPERQDTDIYTKMQSVLLIGQSNMVGTGDVRNVVPVDDDRIFMMRNDEWIKMREPLHNNSGNVGVGLGGSFAKAFVETFDCQLGLIPAALGGSSLEDWAVGGELYNEAIRLAKIAQESSEICALLWHQGEANQNDTNYAAKLKVILDHMIIDLRLDPSKIVIVTGELFGNRSDAVHHAQLVKLGESYANYGIAESDGLTVHDVTTHFDAPSLRVFGYRYFDIFYNCITGKHYSFNNDPNSYAIPIPERAEIDFEDQEIGTAYSGAYGTGRLGVLPQVGIIKIEQDISGNKYMLMANGFDDDANKFSTTYIDSHNVLPPSSVMVLEVKLKLGEGPISKANILGALTVGSTASYFNIRLLATGQICVMTAGNEIGEEIGSLSTNAWTHIRVVLDFENNLKYIYLDGELVVDGIAIAVRDVSGENINRTRVVQFVPDNTAGTILVDDFKCYTENGNNAE